MDHSAVSSFRWFWEGLNLFFFLFHTLLILFNTFGWVFPATRRWNLLTLGLTGFSWFVLGIWYGWGFCFCTQWHWEVRQRLGLNDPSDSYIQFLVLKLSGWMAPINWVDTATLIVFLLSLGFSLGFNIRDWRKARAMRKGRTYRG